MNDFFQDVGGTLVAKDLSGILPVRVRERVNEGEQSAGGSEAVRQGSTQPPAQNSHARFNGEVYDPASDDQRLRKQIGRVWDAMKDGQWRTLGELEVITGDPQASLSAQLRNLRKLRFGGHVINKRARGDRVVGLFEYQLCNSLDNRGVI